MGTLKNLVKQVLTEKENRRYKKLLEARCVSYDSWVRERERKLYDGSGQKKAAEIFYMPWGRLSEHAEALVKEYFAEHPEVQIVYGDEDVWQGAERSNPWYKPDWSPDTFDGWYYFGSVVAVRRDLLERIPCPVEYVQQGQGKNLLAVKGLAAEKEAWEKFVRWVRTCAETCGGWQRGCKAVGHVSEILFHCDSEDSQGQYMQWKRKAVEQKVDAILLSIIIPSKDNPEILEKCVQAIVNNEEKLNYELIIVDNGSSKENKKKIEELLQAYTEDAQVGRNSRCVIQYIYQPMEFNFSQMCNLGAENARGELLLFLNDDVELCQENCLAEMVELAAREYVGAVGCKLYYPDSRRIQHAGITNLPMGPVHKLQFLEDDREYYFNSNRGLRNVLAVTAACLMVEKKKFREVQGFDETLQVAFNDVDFCFKLYEAGYYNVCNNKCYAYHHESLSRGDDESTEKWQRLLKERDTLYSKHPALEGKDPYYGAGLGREGLDTRVRPTFETAGNQIQVLPGNRSNRGVSGSVREITAEALSAYRQDNCLLLRIENCRQGMLQGYGVVLGDNNACYEKEIVLESLETAVEGADKVQKVYTISIEGQYRPDLVENMPDQINVGLSGFWMSTGAEACATEEACVVVRQGCLEKGSYRIGMTAHNRVTGLWLINWSSRIMMVE